jgi:hypothetical protein
MPGGIGSRRSKVQRGDRFLSRRALKIVQDFTRLRRKAGEGRK